MNSKVALIYGGYWEESDISVLSATSVLVALLEEGLSVIPIRWEANGWCMLNEIDSAEFKNAEADLKQKTSNGSDSDHASSEYWGEFLRTESLTASPLDVLQQLKEASFEGVFFNVLHGGPGEDGTLQGFLEVAGFPYTGASVYGSAISANKESYRWAAQGCGFDVPAGFVLERSAWDEESNEFLTQVSVRLGFPVVVKPLNSGSSYGVCLAHDAEKLEIAIETNFLSSRTVLIEQYVQGRELSIGCLGTRVGLSPEVLPIIEIEPLTSSGFFDTDSKYQKGLAKEIVPAPLDDDFAEHVSMIVGSLHQCLDLGACSRTDVILGADGPVLLEVNTVPGFTETSLYPQMGKAAGIEFRDLCRRLIDYALSAHLARRVNLSGNRL